MRRSRVLRFVQVPRRLREMLDASDDPPADAHPKAVPQSLLSLDVFVQLGPQSIDPVGQAHTPITRDEP